MNTRKGPEMKGCDGTNCGANAVDRHSAECLFEHFLSYTGFWAQPPDVLDKLKKAYFDGRDAGISDSAEVVKPKNERPCDCKSCDCGNVNDAEAVARWDADNHSAKAIRALSND